MHEDLAAQPQQQQQQQGQGQQGAMEQQEDGGPVFAVGDLVRI